MSVAEKGRSKLLLRRMGTGGGERQRQGGEAGCLAVQGSCKRCAPPSPGQPPGLMQPRVGAGGWAALLSSPRGVPACPGGKGEKMRQLITSSCHLLSPTLSDKHSAPHPLVTPLPKQKLASLCFTFLGLEATENLLSAQNSSGRLVCFVS